MQSWIHLFIDQVKATTLVEWLAVILGVAEVFLAKANKVWLYPTGIASTLISIYLLLHATLYAECLLSVYYVVMSIYGWYYWVKKRNQPPVKATYANRQEWLTTLLIVFAGWGLLYLILVKFTPSTVPVWDAWVSSTAWAGMWLLARRKIENWVLLNISNIFAIPLLYHKHLVMFAVLTLILFVVAIFGYLEWRRIINREKQDLDISKTLPSGGRGA
ncbi:nicotinamide riboside transporter PnuC [Mucilaginibacter phyllosphaerae]|uniref:Nicotinamide riboside transporter PnuC n=1 Tax=Mucilaginibacter phyllosphaerae TaxID=1812349 RepID=A0A4Y8A5X2_9SPHI|nr:nicotinamide riboside transporter PnuC [Mucilaginibacter phyllosphaerae]MBB3971065.1 nicotinamide mononucleotide transporter [Mucilaginibacter phyllosphaerae]TEW63803.1 nicotinamide riboside transporter PnuC [Mucilaginibacter phyllosphaerae]GGH22261.1 nicotinamide mononucleotide transporter [Mucilaginibacter phyllosphaerae]